MIEASEYADRRRRVAARLEGLDGLLVTHLPNVRYLSGFTGSNGAVLLSRTSATLLTDPRYTIQATEETACRVRIAKGPLITNVAKLIGGKRWRRAGFEAHHIMFAMWQELRKTCGDGVKLVPVAWTVERERMIKSQGEIELIRKSVIANSEACAEALRHVRNSMTEQELASEIDYQMRRAGAEGVAFETIVAAGPRSALPHAKPTAEPLGSNRLLLMDTGALRYGYCSDMTRMAHLGRPGTRSRDLYAAVLESQLAAIDAVKPGATCAQVDAAARKVLRRRGFDKAFLHSTGHGLGLEIHEQPRIARKEAGRLEAGMVVTIEPGAYIEGFGGVRVEDTVVVTGAGCDVLTPTPKELVTI